MKKTICLITNWYPTEDNPYQGLFFKEQALATSEEFKYLVVHYHEHKKRLIFPKKYSVYSKTEDAIREYTIHSYTPFLYYFMDFCVRLRHKLGNNSKNNGKGIVLSSFRKSFIKKTICNIFKKEIKDSFDILYCVDAQLEAYYLYCLAECYHKPYVVGEHAPFPWPGTLITDANVFAIEHANAFIAISYDKIRQVMLQNIKLPQIFYLGNMIDEEKLCLSNKKVEEKIFIIVAANSYYKNYDMLISVMNRLVQITKEDFRLMIVGYAANKGYSKNIEELEGKIKESLFSEKVEMIPSVEHEKIGEVLGRADAFLMTSIQEGQPVSAMEAACCGLPIFSTRCGGVEDYVDNTMGRLYSITDYDGFAQGLKDYLEGRITFDSKLIRKKITSKFGKKVFAEQFSKVMNSVSR